MGVLVIFVIVLLAKTAPIWYNYFVILQDVVSLVQELELKAIAKQICSTMQIVTNLAAVLSISLPTVFGDFIELVASWFRFDIVDLFDLGCLSSGSYVSSLVANIALVVIISISVGLVYLWDARRSDHEDFGVDDGDGLHRRHLKELFDQFDADGKGITATEMCDVVRKINPEADDEQAQQLFDKADSDGGGSIDFGEFEAAVNQHGDGVLDGGLQALVKRVARANIRDAAAGRLFLLVFLLYPALTNKIFEGFICRSIGDNASVLHVDYSVECESQTYTLIWLSCAVLVVLWPIGLPSGLLFMMWKERELIKSGDPDTEQKFEFVLGDYQSRHWYWECVELFRKLILSGLISVFQRGSIAQTVLATLISFMFFAISFHAQPFNTARLNAIKICSEFQIFGILLACVVLQTHQKGSRIATEPIGLAGYGTAQIVLTVAIMPISIWVVGVGLRDLRTEGLLVEAEADQTSEKAKTGKKGKENATTDSDTMAVFRNPMNAEAGEPSPSFALDS